MADAPPTIEKIPTAGAADRWTVFDRWATKLVGVLNAWFRIGTNRLQGFFLPVPTSADDGKSIVFDASAGVFGYAAGGGGGVTDVTATTPIVSSGGTTPNITHADSGATPATYGDATHVAQVAVNAKGHVTAATAVLISGTAPGGAAGGDLTGTYPSPTIAANAVTNAKAAQMATNTIKGNNTGGTANAADLTVAQVNTMLDVIQQQQIMTRIWIGGA